MQERTALGWAFQMMKPRWRHIAVLSALLVVGLYVTKPWAVDYARFEPTGETFNVEVSGYYGYRGERVEFSHVIECRKVIIRDLDDWGGEDWKPNTQIFAAEQADGSTLLYGFSATDNDPSTLGRVDFHCGMFVEDPSQTIERRMRMVWVDDIESPTRAFRSSYFDQPFPMEVGLISPGQITAKRTKRRDVTPINPIIHWAYPMMRFGFTGALGFAHKEHLKHEELMTGFVVFCSDRARRKEIWGSRTSGKWYLTVPAEFVAELCADIASRARLFLPLVPVGDEPDRVVVDGSNPDLWAFHAEPELTRALHRGERAVQLVYRRWEIPVRHTQKFRGNLCPDVGDRCIVFYSSFLVVSRSVAAGLKQEK